MKITFACFILTCSISVCNSQWVLQQSNTNYDLYGVFMINSNTGFFSGDFQTVRRTTNAGLNWLTVNVPNWDYG